MNNLIRREFIALLGAGLAISAPEQAKALPYAGASRLEGLPGGLSPRHLWIRQLGKGDELMARFRTASGSIDRTGVQALRWMFRDWRDSDAAVAVDIRLFDLLATLQSSLSAIHDRAILVTLNSGYRTRERNATIEGAAPNSQHVHGRAADITLSGITPRVVADSADLIGTPGIGRYRSFTHVDVGPAGRRWRG